MFKVISFFLFIFILENSLYSFSLYKVIDGDTIHIGKIKYRLHGIDAPEIKQKCKIDKKVYFCGKKAKNFLINLIKQEKINCKHKAIDRYKRIIAECFIKEKNINAIMVENGWALAYRKYSEDYIYQEKIAKEKKIGIWKGNFENPWDWRKRKRKRN